MKARDIMTPDPELCHENDTIYDCVEIMYQRDCGIVPIVDDNGICIGVVTDRDICLDVVLNRKDPDRSKINEVMTRDPLTCGPDQSLDRVIDEMEKHKVRRILVVNKDNRCIGIISEGDIATRDEEKRHVSELVGAVTAEVGAAR